MTTPTPLYSPTEEDPLRSVEYLAKVLEFPEDTIRDWLRTGRITGRKVGGQWRVPQSELTRFVNQEYGDAS